MAIISLWILLIVVALTLAGSLHESLEQKSKVSKDILFPNELVDLKQFVDSQQLLEYHESLESSPTCFTGCPRILDPICAVDDTNPNIYKYFHNQCIMDYDNCRQNKAWKPTQMLLCIEDVDPLLRAHCMRACPLIYNPVCASDGKNYEIFGNQCIFAIEKCLTSSKWLVVRAEQCGL